MNDPQEEARAEKKLCRVIFDKITEMFTNREYEDPKEVKIVEVR